MSCESINEKMMKHFDGEINDIEEAQLMQHLKGCRSCSEEFRCMREVFKSMEDAPGIEPPEDFEIKVMDRINAMVFAQKTGYSRMLVILYNLTSILSIVLLMVFAADIKQVDVINVWTRVQEYFGSFTSATAAIGGVAKELFGLVANIVESLVQVIFTIARTYYFVFVALVAMLAVIQGLLRALTPKEGRKTV